MSASPPHPVLDDISVVIPTLGRPTLRDTLESVAAGDHWPAALIVSQQGDETAPESWIAELRARGLTIVHEHHRDERGVARGRNRGIAQVTTPYLCLTDDDCVVDRNWLKSMRDAIATHDCVVVGSVHPHGDGVVPSTTTSTEVRVVTEPSLGSEPFFPNNTGYPQWVAERVGGYDTDVRIRFAEDGDYSYRILRAGVPIRYDPSIRLRHVAWRDEAQLDVVFAQYAWCIGALYGKWIRRGDMHMAKRAARDLVRIPWWLLKGRATGNDELSTTARNYVQFYVPGIVGGLRRRLTEAEIPVIP